MKIKLPSKTALYLSLYGFLTYLVLLVANIPAQQIWQFIPQQNKARLQMGHLQGTLWSGQADNLKINKLSLGKFDWDLNLLPLFIGQLDLDTKIRGPLGTLQSNIAISTDGSLQASELSGRVPAESLNPYTLPATLQGKLDLNIQSLLFQLNQQLQLEGEIIWRKASITMLQTIELGKVRLLAKADGNGSTVYITNEKSALGIEGTIKLDAKGRYNLNLALLNRDSSRKDIRSLLQMLGKADAAGKVYLRRQGQLQLNF